MVKKRPRRQWKGRLRGVSAHLQPVEILYRNRRNKQLVPTTHRRQRKREG
jgi:hypothetical protein